MIELFSVQVLESIFWVECVLQQQELVTPVREHFGYSLRWMRMNSRCGFNHLDWLKEWVDTISCVQTATKSMTWSFA